MWKHGALYCALFECHRCGITIDYLPISRTQMYILPPVSLYFSYVRTFFVIDLIRADIAYSKKSIQEEVVTILSCSSHSTHENHRTSRMKADERKRRRMESGMVEEGILETLPAGPGAVALRERMKELRVGMATGIRRSAGNGETEKGRQLKEKRRKRRGLRTKGGRGEEHAGRIDGGSSVARLTTQRINPLGFGFITFADPASVDKVLAQGNHELDGKKENLQKEAVSNQYA
ncbi:RNA-binding protein Musashi-like protein Rbp6 [Acromyrmex echinatior]|uniref:RNA-binding protein Musashi-like protein Rbp6 n=1 Tax=Acromyrmex echinatior TaxID=103372 RepID=F4WQC0_ACREC|nr:RNA-binding protein Musashi-like protein Rbp6 [Acromyrmex echinatior]